MNSQTSARRRAVSSLRHLQVPVLRRWLRWAAVLWCSVAVAVVLVAATSYWGFVQDDAFISLRYAQNLAAGHGLVFNPGERVEGISNLGWTLIAYACLKVGISPLAVLRVLGVLSAVAMVLSVASYSRRGRSRAFASATAPIVALLLATSPTLQVWSISGLEEVSFAVLAFVALECAGSGRVRTASALAAASALLRPEGALVVLVLGVSLAMRAIGGRRRPSRLELGAAVAAAVPSALVQAFRISYYGEWVPNTFFVKGVVTPETIRLGVSELHAFATITPHGALLVAGVVGIALHVFRARDDLRQRAIVGALFSGIYAAHVIRIGGDVLPLYRLWLPLLPFGATWSARAVSWIAATVRATARRPTPRAVFTYLFAFIALSAVSDAAYRACGGARYKGFLGVHNALEASQGRVGRELDAAAGQLGRPITVAAQDIGLMGAVAPSVRVVDVIGLADRTVAKALYRHAYTPFIRASLLESVDGRERVAHVDAEVRDYVLSRDLDYVVVNVHCPIASCRHRAERLDAAFFAPFTRANPYYYEMTADIRFERRFELVSAVRYSATTYLLLYRARVLRELRSDGLVYGPSAG